MGVLRGNDLVCPHVVADTHFAWRKYVLTSLVLSTLRSLYLFMQVKSHHFSNVGLCFSLVIQVTWRTQECFIDMKERELNCSLHFQLDSHPSLSLK